MNPDLLMMLCMIINLMIILHFYHLYLDKYFIQYFSKINSAILFPPLDDGSIPKEKSSF